jgi:hypothetical protein
MADEPDWARSTHGVPEEVVRWGFRMLAGRDPLTTAELAAYQAMPSLAAMRRTLANTHEFHAFFDSLLTGHQAWTMPLFLLRPPSVEGLEWRFTPPDLEKPVCQLCTRAQFDQPMFAEIAAAMGANAVPTRAMWEQAWIVSVLAEAGLIEAGRRGLGIEAGRDRVASLVAARGVEVVATAGGVENAHAAELRRTQLFFPEAIHIEEFDQLVTLVGLEAARIAELPRDGFDFCWSIGAPGRLGSVNAALDFFEASLAPLRPGGLAAHTFTLNLTSDGLTWQEPDNVLVRRRDVEALATRLQAAGHRLLPLNTHPGESPEDEVVHGVLGGPPGHRQRRGMMVGTSFGLAIRKAT